VGLLGITAVAQSRIAVFTDTSCLDPLNTAFNCLYLLKPILSYLSTGWLDRSIFPNEAILPHDYDNHIESHFKLPELWPVLLDYERLIHLQCIEFEDSYVANFDFHHHNTTAIKL
jgi:hypothetical protein